MLSRKISIAAATAIVTLGAAAPFSAAQVAVPGEEPPFRPLVGMQGVEPRMPDLTGIVVNRDIAIALGKALFWDIQAGSDGMACASCHFAAGADTRIINQLNPGEKDLRFTNGDKGFGGLTAAQLTQLDKLSPGETAGLTASVTKGGNTVARPNLTLENDDFDLHQLADPKDRNSAIRYTTNDVVSSAGTFGGALINVTTGQPIDSCADPDAGSVYHNLAGQSTRVVEPRNTPTAINAIYNVRNFWDGRANNTFNGEDPFGARNANAFVVEAVSTSVVRPYQLRLTNASLASQAVGPPLSSSESSCAGRFFAQIGRKLGSLRPLASQVVAATDSRLGIHRHVSGKGLNKTYSQLIRTAFDSKWWRAVGKWRRGTGTQAGMLIADSTAGFTQQELNFSMFWGISIMLYESTLRSVPGDSPFDRHAAGAAAFAANSPEMRGMQLFTGKAQCASCHDGPLFSKAAKHVEGGVINPALDRSLVERMPGAHEASEPAFYDEGFYNIGVTPSVADLGLGARDPWGNPLSLSRQFLQQTPFPTTLAGQSYVDSFKVDPCTFESPLTENAPELCTPESELPFLVPAAQRHAVDGSFKTPSLRNVGLTAPYFHNGGYATLESVIQFYNRGGNRRGNDPTKDDAPPPPPVPGEIPLAAEELPQLLDFDETSGTGQFGNAEAVANQGRGSNLAPDIKELGLTPAEISDLAAFLLTLTDDRVRCDMAPFDHPQLPIPHGHLEPAGTATGKATDLFEVLPAVGASGHTDPLRCLQNHGRMQLMP